MSGQKPDPNCHADYPTYAMQPPYPQDTQYPTYPQHPPYPVVPNAPFPVRPTVAYPPFVPPYTSFGTTARHNKGLGSGMPPSYNEVTGETRFHQHPPMSTYAPPSQSAYWGPIEHPIHLGAIYDPGARFNNRAQPSIPPPPPGVAPCPAQIAAMYGWPIIASKKKSSFLNGSGDGGFTLF